MTARTGRVLPRSFFARPSPVVAPELLGHVVEHRTPAGVVAVRLTEVEAYEGADDPASHAYRGPRPRTEVMFGPPGHVYVYFTYGMHFCMNLVCRGEGEGSAVLLRAGEVVRGVELARERRARGGDRELARGPARLTVALGVARAQNGADACAGAGAFAVRAGSGAAGPLLATPRTGVAQGAETPWRFCVDGDPTVSPYRRHVPKRRDR